MNDSFDVDYRRWKDWEEAQFGVFSALDDAYFRAELERAGLPRGQCLRILEIGFGNGQFLAWARSEGHHATGVEVQPALRARAHAMNVPVYALESEIPETERFDLIVAWDVFEHIEKTALGALLQSVRPKLTPRGRIIARFPNAGSPFGQFYQWGDTTHVTALTSDSVNQLAFASGLKLLRYGAPCMPVRGIGLARSVRRTMLSAVRALIERFVRFAFFDGRPVPISPNLVVVLEK